MGFRIGGIVMRMDGDKRPHKIVDITVHYPLNRNEHTFFMYHYDGIKHGEIRGAKYLIIKQQ